MLRYAVPTCCRCTVQVGTDVKHLAAWLMQALGWGKHLHGAQAVVVAADVSAHHGDGLRDGLQRRLVPPPHQRPHLPQGGRRALGLVQLTSAAVRGLRCLGASVSCRLVAATDCAANALFYR